MLQIEPEQRSNRFRLGLVDDQLAVDDIIAERHDTTHPHAFPLGGGDLVSDALAGDLALELGEGQQHVEGEPAHRGRRVRRGQNSLCFLAAAYAAIGREEKARAAMKAFLDKFPKRTLSNYQHSRIYKRKEDLDRYLNLLRKAGMPE